MNTGSNAQGVAKSVTWSDLKIETLSLELLDDSTYQILQFGKKGIVAATIGKKNGPLTGPIFYWRVEGDHLLISEGPKSNTVFDLYQPRVAGKYCL